MTDDWFAVLCFFLGMAQGAWCAAYTMSARNERALKRANEGWAEFCRGQLDAQRALFMRVYAESRSHALAAFETAARGKVNTDLSKNASTKKEPN